MSASSHGASEGIARKRHLDVEPDRGESPSAFASRVLDAVSELLVNYIAGRLTDRRSKSMRAATRRVTRHDTGEQMTQTRGAFAAALGRPCARYAVEAEVPCWDLLGHPAVCGARTGSDFARVLITGAREDGSAGGSAEEPTPTDHRSRAREQ